jgi:hypothetical protein
MLLGESDDIRNIFLKSFVSRMQDVAASSLFIVLELDTGSLKGST